MNRTEKNIYYQSLKNLSDMNIAQIELNKRDRIIAEMRNANSMHVNTIAAMKKENEELKRRLGLNSASNLQ